MYSASEKNTIENDAEHIDKLVASAKHGNWENVWKILGTPESPKQSRLINVIPENRRWGVLHQAVYWNDKDVLQRLLRFGSCDSEMKAKQCTSECGPTSGMNAREIAEAYKYQEMADIISNHECKLDQQPIPTLLPAKGYSQRQGLCLIAITIAAYRKTFHPQPIDKNKSIIVVLRDVFNNIMTSDPIWKEVKEKVCDTVYVVCKENYRKIKQSKTRDDFFETIIDTYTAEENYMYTYLNTAFRRQRVKHYRPTADDLALGPYAVMYQMLLLFWNKLPRERLTTYRKMLLSAADIAMYQVGKTFIWQSIASSSTILRCAVPFPTCGPEGDKSVIFTIDNSTDNTWQPRNIEKYARYMEHERTYPAGAKFKVTGRTTNGSDIHVSLKLL